MPRLESFPLHIFLKAFSIVIVIVERQDFKDFRPKSKKPFDCDSSKAGSVRDSTIFDTSEHLKVRNFLFPFPPAPTLKEGNRPRRRTEPPPPMGRQVALLPTVAHLVSPPGDNCGVSAPCVDDDLRASRGDVPALQHRPAPPHLRLLAALHHGHVQHLLPQPASPLGLLDIVSPLPPPLPGAGLASQEGTS